MRVGLVNLTLGMVCHLLVICMALTVYRFSSRYSCESMVVVVSLFLVAPSQKSQGFPMYALHVHIGGRLFRNLPHSCLSRVTYILGKL